MLDVEMSVGPQQERRDSINGGFIPYRTALINTCEEKLTAECCQFENWSRLMTSGNFEAAWRMNDSCGSHWPSAHRLWDGRLLQGANLVVHAKHGLGDAVQMLQYAQRLRDLSACIRFDLPVSLRGLMPYFRGVRSECTKRSSSSKQARIIELEMMELPYLFRTRLEDLPLATGYLAIAESISKHYLACMGSTLKPRVGIVWKGGEWDRDRWIPLNILSSLIANDAYEWWNLQGGPAMSEAYVFPLKSICRNSDEGLVALAATVSNLDLIITVDTLAAHLAAALGKPTWLLLKHDADWRWLSGRDDSPWYPSLRLFRQPSRGDWSGVVSSVERALNERRISRKAAGFDHITDAHPPNNR